MKKFLLVILPIVLAIGSAAQSCSSQSTTHVYQQALSDSFEHLGVGSNHMSIVQVTDDCDYNPPPGDSPGNQCGVTASTTISAVNHFDVGQIVQVGGTSTVHRLGVNSIGLVNSRSYAQQQQDPQNVLSHGVFAMSVNACQSWDWSCIWAPIGWDPNNNPVCIHTPFYEGITGQFLVCLSQLTPINVCAPKTGY